VHHLSVKIRGGLAAAMLAALAGGWAVPARAQTPGLAPAAPAEKKVKDQGEYDIFNQVNVDIQANNFAKAITDLDTWKQKYPSSDFKDDRSVLYVQAYAGSNQPAKAIDEAGLLIAKGLKTVLNDPKGGPGQQLKVLVTTAATINQVPAPTADELATAAKAAQQLLDYNKPEGATEAAWAAARVQLQSIAKGTLLYIAMKPGTDAMRVAGPAAAAAVQASKQQPPDAALVARNRAAADAAYGAAEAAFLAALQQYPDSSQIAYQLGASELGQQITYAAKISLGLYEVARAVSIDPAKSDFADAKARSDVDAYLKRVYTQYHGADEGLDQLKQQALAAPVPPADFHILSATEILNAKQKEFAAKYPELALWMSIKAALSDTGGQQYFDENLKVPTQLPKLKGILVDAKPACHAKELLVAVPLPDAKPPFVAEIALKLDAPLTGKADQNVELVWNDGQPSAFSRDPFLLTIDVEKAKVSGLKVTPCAPPPVVHHPVAKKKA
jgi:hypothetical protein